MGIDRRGFLKVATTTGAGLALTGASSLSANTKPTPRGVGTGRNAQTADVVVVGGGAFGAWTALNLLRSGASVTLVDQYGPGNSRATSGGETRGVRSSYGDRPHGRLWVPWAKEAIRRWTEWDEANADLLLPKVFFQTGDLIMREEWEPYLEDTRAHWDSIGAEYEVLTPEEIANRWPVIRLDEVGVGLYEPDAGVVRARRAIESVAQVFRHEGGEIRIGKVAMGARDGRTLDDVVLTNGDRISGGVTVFALGPWFPKFFPELMGKRLRISMGNVYYMATPPGDESYRFPNIPSYGVPGATGWPALWRDSRGFRVRTGGRGGGRDVNEDNSDPDTSVRWIAEEHHARPREILATYFPALAEQPINETRSCHYESSVDRNFFVDHHPDFDNVWLTGGGSAEGFKFGPVLGEYIAGRVLGTENDPELIASFRLKEEEFEDEEEDPPEQEEPPTIPPGG